MNRCNLTVNRAMSVAQGGFLAFIVNGNVSVGSGQTGMQGIYIMDGTFTTNSVYVEGVTNDVPIDVQGSVIAWNSVSLNRNLGLTNNTTPAEKFTYRPDLLINMPEAMKTFALRWQEVAPGTF